MTAHDLCGNEGMKQSGYEKPQQYVWRHLVEHVYESVENIHLQQYYYYLRYKVTTHVAETCYTIFQICCIMLYLVKGTTPAAETILRDGHARNSTELTRQVGHTRISSAVSYFGGSKTSVVEQFLDLSLIII